MLLVKLLDPRAVLPTCSRPGEDLAYDVYALEETTVNQYRTAKVRTGVAVQHQSSLDAKEGLLVRDRSSMAAKGLFVTGGVIDAGYTGELVVLMNMHGITEYTIQAGDKIAQLIPVPALTALILAVDELPGGNRGSKAFGSSGR